MEKLKDQFQEFNSDLDRRRIYEREALAMEATELISQIMEDNEVTKSELAQMLGSSKSNVTSILSGSRNLTMHTLADVAFVLGHKVLIKSAPLTADASWEEIPNRVIVCKFDKSKGAYEFDESPSPKPEGRATTATPPNETPFETNIQFA